MIETQKKSFPTENRKKNIPCGTLFPAEAGHICIYSVPLVPHTNHFRQPPPHRVEGHIIASEPFPLQGFE